MHRPNATPWSRAPRRQRALRGRRALVAAVAGCSLLTVGVQQAGANVASASASTPSAATTPYPIGVFDEFEPSGLAPPPPNALPGYARTFVSDFTAPLSHNWFLFRGVPAGDPSGRFDPLHVGVAKGMLKVGTWRDPRFSNHWVSGGAGLDSVSILYGAVFIRSRETAPGPDTVALLWPTNNQWPPEIDFVEAGNDPSSQMWFVHYYNASSQVWGRTQLNIEHWHTYGVIWTSSSIIFTVDGQPWGEVTNRSQIPNLPMNLDLQAQSWCGISGEPCPTRASTLEVDWVAVYSPTS